MESDVSIFSSPLFWGFVTGIGLGAVFLCLSMIAHWKTKRELRRYQQHLSDKLQIEAEQFGNLKKDTERLKGENENLRLKIGAGKSGETLESLERELEILARAERRMMVNAPGFAGAWESAKSAANSEIEEEERGKSLPRRLFRKFFPGSTGEHDHERSAPARISTTKTVEADSSESPFTENRNASVTVTDAGPADDVNSADPSADNGRNP